jgi:hypothetical protein
MGVRADFLQVVLMRYLLGPKLIDRHSLGVSWIHGSLLSKNPQKRLLPPIYKEKQQGMIFKENPFELSWRVDLDELTTFSILLIKKSTFHELSQSTMICEVNRC